MFQVAINEKGGPSREERFEKDEVNIGRVQGNDIILPKGNISKRHSRIVLKDDKVVVVDLKSTNGTYVNGKKIQQPQVVKPSDKVYIGDFTLQVTHLGEAADPPRSGGFDLFGGAATSASPRAPMDAVKMPAPVPEALPSREISDFKGGDPDSMDSQIGAELDRLGHSTAMPVSEIPPEADPRLGEAPMTMGPGAVFQPAPFGVAPVAGVEPWSHSDLVRKLHVDVVELLNLRGMELAALPAMRDEVFLVAERMIQQMAASGLVAPGEDHELLANEVANLATNVQLILDLIREDQVVEIVVTQDREILADREARLDPIDRVAQSEAQVIQLIHTLGVLGGADPGPDQPLVNVRLRDGSRVVASLPPLAFRGPSLNLRKSARDYFTLKTLVEYDCMSEAMMGFIDHCVRFRVGILLSVGPGIEPTATLNALLEQMPPDMRIVTLESGVELHAVGRRNVTAFEPSQGMRMAELVDHAVALQVDRLVTGILDEADLPEVIRATAGPLEGSVLSIQAESSEAAVKKLQKQTLEVRGEELSVHDLVASVRVVLQEDKFLDNSRRITAISELVVNDAGELEVHDIFRFTPEGMNENLMMTGRFEATGYVPSFLKKLNDRREAEIDLSVFES